jgi:hypothetical protein
MFPTEMQIEAITSSLINVNMCGGKFLVIEAVCIGAYVAPKENY